MEKERQATIRKSEIEKKDKLRNEQTQSKVHYLFSAVEYVNCL
jgi:hypothetical protein